MESLLMKGGSGADLDLVTAGAGDVLAGKVIVDKNGNPLTGTMSRASDYRVATLTAADGRSVLHGKSDGNHDGSWGVTNSDGNWRVCTEVGVSGYFNNRDIVGISASSAARALGLSLLPAHAIRKGYTLTIKGIGSVTGTYEGYWAYRKGGVWGGWAHSMYAANINSSGQLDISISDNGNVAFYGINTSMYSKIELWGNLTAIALRDTNGTLIGRTGNPSNTYLSIGLGGHSNVAIYPYGGSWCFIDNIAIS